MKLKNILLCSSVVLTPFFVNAQTKPATKKVAVKPKTTSVIPAHTTAHSVSLASLKDSASYGLGILVAQNFKMQNIEINAELLQKGFNEVMKGAPTPITDMQANQLLQKYMQKEQSKQFEPNRLAGEKFLADNKKKDGIVTLASGLQYQILKKGDGPIPIASDKVKTHYHGTLIDGTVFDSSVDRGEPISFPVTGVIQGWVEALQLMPVGSKWKLFVPYELAYGTRGSGPTIKPYSALVFEVELLGIEK
ncbi:FKBP-type peptidyl-prolyl cis-trans isomerase [Arcicella aquatica]|uniref:Peptidyl-prolyl cis-trans isomerase n=1 Tax=Arcicella aquatica TaxID=217141 RepID=A0ABU5QQ38_9BACT|nr:FKBP-type peptidyl-prolyl cis-trans isomerase [Arcicella aquatica]MEA5259128.1 FKBP-type peptidyl-prolyl cis-trans isomerase [Arcicella aquatica]